MNIIGKSTKLFLSLNVVVWFTIGSVIAYLFGLLPFFYRLEYFSNPYETGAFMAIVVGYIGGILWLVRKED